MTLMHSFWGGEWHPEHSPGPYFLQQPDPHFSRAETPRSEGQQGHALHPQPPELLCIPPEMAVQGQAASKGDLQNRQLLYTMRLQAPSLYPTWLSIPTPTARFLSVFKVLSMLLFVCFMLLEQQWISKTFDSNCMNWHVGDFVKARWWKWALYFYKGNICLVDNSCETHLRRLFTDKAHNMCINFI